MRTTVNKLRFIHYSLQRRLWSFLSRLFSDLDSGLSLLETIVAVAFSVITVGALIILGITSARASSTARDRSQAVELAKEGIEAVRVIRDNVPSFSGDDFAVINNDCATVRSAWQWVTMGTCPWLGTTYDLGKSSNWNLQYLNDGGDDLHTDYQLASPYDSFYRKVIVEDYVTGEVGQKLITVVVSWKDKDEIKNVTESTVFTNWK